MRIILHTLSHSLSIILIQVNYYHPILKKRKVTQDLSDFKLKLYTPSYIPSTFTAGPVKHLGR